MKTASSKQEKIDAILGTYWYIARKQRWYFAMPGWRYKANNKRAVVLKIILALLALSIGLAIFVYGESLKVALLATATSQLILFHGALSLFNIPIHYITES